MFEYVIYRIDFRGGKFYIGKAKNFFNRKDGHLNGCINGKTLKDKVLFNSPYKFTIIDHAPENWTDYARQNWMDNMEKRYIHDYARQAYNEITGLNTDYDNYSDYRHIINRKMVNTQLY